jgi:phosphatidyl-myo-inositol alpha-mannosyltransferase
MLRIGICAPYDLGKAGGVNSHIRAQARALRQLGHAVSVFGASSVPLPAGEQSVSGCLSLVIGGTETGIGVDPRAWPRVRRLAEHERFDVVHVHEPLMPFVPWCAVLRSGVPVAATFHAHREHGHRFYPVYQLLLAPLMNRVDLRIAVSDAARRTVAAHFPGDYLVVPNGVDGERFERPAPRPSDMPRGTLHILFVGRLEPRKGVEHLVDAMERLRVQGRHVRLIVVGDGPDRGSLTARASRAGIDAVFAGGVDDAALPGYYQAADVVCSPATGGESFGIVLLEALAARRPVVATSIEGYLEVAGQEAGPVRFVPPGDSSALAHELSALLEDGRLRERLGAAGAAFASRFDWRAIARRLETLYRELIDASASPAALRVG